MTFEILTFDTKIEGNDVLVHLPSVDEVDAILGTKGLRVMKSDCIDLAQDAIKVKLASERQAKKFSKTMLMAKKEPKN